jgi:hypothetical protein
MIIWEYNGCEIDRVDLECLIYCVEYNMEWELIVVGGSDNLVKIYINGVRGSV